MFFEHKVTKYNEIRGVWNTVINFIMGAKFFYGRCVELPVELLPYQVSMVSAKIDQDRSIYILDVILSEI